MERNYITEDFFKKRLADLFLRSGLTEFPVKHQDQLIILKSISISFAEDRDYAEIEVNQTIKNWLADINLFPGWDHITLRRRLVDAKFLNRNPEGSCYRLNPAGPAGVVFDPAITGVKVEMVLEEGKRLIAQRKAEYLQT